MKFGDMWGGTRYIYVCAREDMQSDSLPVVGILEFFLDDML